MRLLTSVILLGNSFLPSGHRLAFFRLRKNVDTRRCSLYIVSVREQLLSEGFDIRHHKPSQCLPVRRDYFCKLGCPLFITEPI